MLELDLTTTIFEIVNFLLLTLLLYRFLFQPVLRNVQARAAEKDRLRREIEEERQAAARTRVEWETRLAQADQEAADLIAQARRQTETERTEVLHQTQAEVERILAEAHLDAYQTQQQALDNFHQELVTLILDTSGGVVRRIAPPEIHDTLVQQLNERVWGLGQNGIKQVKTIRRSLQDRSATVYITTAHPLSSEQQNQLFSTFTALADREVTLDIQTDPNLITGLRARLGDTVIDNSLAGQLADLQADVVQAVKTYDPQKELAYDERLKR